MDVGDEGDGLETGCDVGGVAAAVVGEDVDLELGAEDGGVGEVEGMG